MDGQIGQARSPRPPFDAVSPTEASLAKMSSLRVAFSDIYSLISTIEPGRERQLAITNLQQAAMWANLAVCTAQSDVEPL